MKTISFALLLFLIGFAICVSPAALLAQEGQNVHFVGSPVVQSADQHSATIVWNTNAPSSSRVMYGTNTNNLNQLAEAPYGGTKHEVKINNLQPVRRSISRPSRTRLTVAELEASALRRLASPQAGPICAASAESPENLESYVGRQFRRHQFGFRLITTGDQQRDQLE